jgi:hypothetical protein
MGSLLSELLQIHEGKYIVRASIQVGGSTLATGLSAAHTIEQAEDQARSRALVILGIDVSPPHSAQNHLGQNHLGQPYPTQVHFMHSETEELPQRAPQARLSPPATQADFLPMGEAAFQRALEVDWNPADLPALGFPTPEQQLSWLNTEPEPSIPSNASAPQARSGAQPTANKRQRSLQSSPQEKPRTEAATEHHLAAPIDLSEVIAQTDVELKRLGWTHVQGRRYLEKTYSKRSRQHLTDAELIEFLDYLTAQPANSKPAL